MVLKDKIKISDSEKIFGGAYKNSIFYTVFFNKEKIFKSRHKGNFAEINYELSGQLHSEQSRTTHRWGSSLTLDKALTIVY